MGGGRARQRHKRRGGGVMGYDAWAVELVEGDGTPFNLDQWSDQVYHNNI
jgi:hypothetical protein